MKNYKVTYKIGEDQFTEEMSEGRFDNLCKRIEEGTADEFLIEWQEI